MSVDLRYLATLLVLASPLALAQPEYRADPVIIDLSTDTSRRPPLTLSTARVDVYGGDPDLAKRVVNKG